MDVLNIIRFLLSHKEICSTSGSEDSGYTKQALEECLAAYKIRGCASASVVRCITIYSLWGDCNGLLYKLMLKSSCENGINKIT